MGIHHLLRIIFLFWSACNLWSQEAPKSFFTPSDSLDVSRRNKVVLVEGALGGVTLVGLHQLWYADYPQSNFHFINDSNEWLQMDKMGHLYSSYQIGRMGADVLHWSGVSKKDQLIYGATLGFAFLSVVEVMDGFSKQWGASPGDILANGLGTALFVSQELLWQEQRIVPKFSFHPTSYAKWNGHQLGSSFAEQLLKDYNGQTYWMSINLASFYQSKILPKWLNVALGYGADGMIRPYAGLSDSNFDPIFARQRQFYLSFDIDLTKIPTKNSTIKTLFSLFNTLKFPAPTLSYSTKSGFKAYYVYF